MFINYLKKLYIKLKCRSMRKKFGNVEKSTCFSPKKKNYNELKNIYLGKYTSIGPNTLLLASKKGKIIIKDGSILGPSCKIYTRNHNYDCEGIDAIPYNHIQKCADVVIEEGVWIGESVIILPGVTIGKGAVIGAGSVITKNIPAYAVAAGNPAFVIKYRDKERFDRLLENRVFINSLERKKEFIKDTKKIKL